MALLVAKARLAAKPIVAQPNVDCIFQNLCESNTSSIPLTHLSGSFSSHYGFFFDNFSCKFDWLLDLHDHILSLPSEKTTYP